MKSGVGPTPQLPPVGIWVGFGKGSPFVAMGASAVGSSVGTGVGSRVYVNFVTGLSVHGSLPSSVGPHRLGALEGTPVATPSSM